MAVELEIDIEEHRERRAREEERVIGWRMEQLERAGYSETAALAIALRSEIDLHVAVGLLGRGCPPQTATDILL